MKLPAHATRIVDIGTMRQPEFGASIGHTRSAEVDVAFADDLIDSCFGFSVSKVVDNPPTA